MRYLNKAVDLVIIFVLFYGLYTCKGLYEGYLGHTYQRLLLPEMLFLLGNVALVTVAVLLCCRGVVRVSLPVEGPVKLFIGIVLLVLSGAYFEAALMPAKLWMLMIDFSTYAQLLLGVWLALVIKDKLDKGRG